MSVSFLCVPTSQGERVRQMVSQSQPAAIRIKLIVQLEGTFLPPDEATRLRDQLAPGAVNIIQKFVQVSELMARLWCKLSCQQRGFVPEQSSRACKLLKSLYNISRLQEWHMLAKGLLRLHAVAARRSY